MPEESALHMTTATADLEQNIRTAREALHTLAPDAPDRAGWLNNLGVHLGNRYSRTGAMADLEESIEVGREAMEATRSDHPYRAAILNNLGAHLEDRYSRTGAMADLEEAIRVGREAIDATPLDHPRRAGRLNNLRAYLSDRSSRTGAMADLKEAIRVGREAIDATPLDHPDRAQWLDELGVDLRHRYSQTGAMADLEEAIRVGREAIDATPLHHPLRATMLNNLGARLANRHSRTGAMADLEEAIQIGREAIDAAPPDHLDRVMLHNLGVDLHHRHSRTGAMADLEEAIRVGREAIDATPLDHPDRAMMLDNLGTHLRGSYSRTGAIADLEEAIRVGREAIDATRLDHPHRAMMLNNLGTRLGDRYSRTEAVVDLEEAIQIGREAIDAVPLDHPHRAMMLNNLGIRLGDRYSRTGAMADLEGAIQIGREAIDATPLDHPDRAMMLYNLGTRLGGRYSRTGAAADQEKATECFIAALHQSTSPVRIRITAGRQLVSSPAILQHEHAYAIAKTTIDLIPLLTPRSLQNTDKRHLLSAAVGLSSDAVAIALHANKGPAAAIELLETGRGVIAGSLFEQADLAALEHQYPDLARSFIDLRDQLDASPPAGSLATAERPTGTADTEDDWRRDAGPRLAGLLDTIRSKPGFKRFLLSASETDMLEAARRGTIVVLNVSSYRCDALIIEESGIRLLELPHLSEEALSDRIQELETPVTLGWLWDAIVCPVLNVLGFNKHTEDSQWPHIWWVPTGTLTRFPLHAAGHHLRRTGETAVDRVVSSYASSIKAIIRSRQRPYQAQGSGEPRNVVAVAMKTTPKQTPLKHATDEIDTVLAVCESMGLPYDRPQQYKADVSSALKGCSIFHFAGHGSTHPTEPLESQLLLDDWDQEPFTVASLLETNFTAKAPFLAYLSACGTGQVLDDGSVDESIHLANAFQLAGFRHVIGTLWSVDDELCVDMAKMTYEFLRDEGVEDEMVSRGLHRAMRTLRDQWVDGEDSGPGHVRPSRAVRDVELTGGWEPSRPLWVPYVHFGV